MRGPKLSPEDQDARNRYNVQKHSAIKKRSIPFELTFEEWYKIWKDSGHWEERGRGGYVMARNGDTGAYAVDNVQIKHHVDNMYDARGTKRPPRTKEHLEKISQARKGQPSYWKGKKVPIERIEKYIKSRTQKNVNIT